MKLKANKLFIASDHAGFHLKEKLRVSLQKKNYKVKDLGARLYKKSDDYPVYMARVARAVQKDLENNKGIILGASGQGEAMAVNRFKGVRAAVYYGGSLDIIKLSRKHNDSNILSLGARFLTEQRAREAVLLWLKTPFSGHPRHKRRIKKIDPPSPSTLSGLRKGGTPLRVKLRRGKARCLKCFI